MKILGVIPARYKSTRFPGKPLADIHGRPMISWVYNNAAQVDLFDQVLIATDDSRIDAVCKELGVPTIMTSSKHKTGTDRVAEVAKRIPADVYVNIQGDEPMLKPNAILAAIEPFLDGNKRDFGVTNLMTPIQRMSDLVDDTVPKVVVNDEGDAIYLSRLPIPYPKDNHEITYYKQICAYGFRPESLKHFSELPQGPSERAEGIELLRFIEHGIKVHMVTIKEDTVAVDTPSDLELVRKYLA